MTTVVVVVDIVVVWWYVTKVLVAVTVAVCFLCLGRLFNRFSHDLQTIDKEVHKESTHSLSLP